jgi:hypothetical protein
MGYRDGDTEIGAQPRLAVQLRAKEPDMKTADRPARSKDECEYAVDRITEQFEMIVGEKPARGAIGVAILGTEYKIHVRPSVLAALLGVEI